VKKEPIIDTTNQAYRNLINKNQSKQPKFILNNQDLSQKAKRLLKISALN